MDKLGICLKVLAQPGYACSLGADEFEVIGYDAGEPDWPSYVGIIRRAMVVVQEAGIDPKDQQAVLQANREYIPF